MRAIEDIQRLNSRLQIAEGPIQQAGQMAGDTPLVVPQWLASESVPDNRHELEDHVKGIDGNPPASQIGQVNWLAGN
jgi:hypothetical protein